MKKLYHLKINGERKYSIRNFDYVSGELIENFNLENEIKKIHIPKGYDENLYVIPEYEIVEEQV